MSAGRRVDQSRRGLSADLGRDYDRRVPPARRTGDVGGEIALAGNTHWGRIMTNKALSPYLEDPNRLADVIAAIQATALYRIYKLDFRGWADRIGGDENQANHWRDVFAGQP